MRGPLAALGSSSGLPPSPAAKRVAVLGIGSLPGLLFCGLGLVLAVAALALGPRARREIDASGGQLGGAELLRLAQICAVVALVTGLAVLVIGALVVSVFVFAR